MPESDKYTDGRCLNQINTQMVDAWTRTGLHLLLLSCNVCAVLLLIYLFPLCVHLHVIMCTFHCLFADAINLFLQKLFLVVPQDNPDELDWD